MRILVFLTVISFLFLLIFIISDTWETHRVVEERHGIKYNVTKHSIRWDRFFNYIKNIPKEIQKSIFHK